LTKEFLEEEHINKNRSVFSIAKETNVDTATVVSYLAYWGIDFCPNKYPNRKNSNHTGWLGYQEISSTYFKNLKTGARNRKLEFSITIEEIWDLYIKQKRKCALTGREIGFQGSKNNSASLDRKDASIGYTIDNVQWVHKDINYAKQSLNNEDFINLCQEVVDHSNKL
jgi:hypothetical protein